LAAVLSSAQRGLACGAEGELRGALLSLELVACMGRAQFAEIITLGAEAIALLPEGTRRWCRSFRHVCVAAASTDRTALLAELAPRFARVEPGADARAEYVHGATWFAIILGIKGMKEESRAFRERAWRAGASVSRGDLPAWGYLTIMEANDRFVVEEAPWSCLIRYAEAKDSLQRYQVLTCAFHGRAWYDLGDPEGAEAGLRGALAQAERRGDAVPLAYVRVYLARLLAQSAPRDRLEEPEALARDVIVTKSATLLGDAHGVLAEIRRRQGDLALAEREARAACEAVRPFPGYAWRLIALHARILLEQGRSEEARAVAEAGVGELSRLGLEGSGEIELRLSLAEALHAAGRAEDGRATLADVIPRLKKRLDDIPEPAARERYLANVPANARVVALAKEWLGEEAVRALAPGS
jgi:eukaryotic-like serine/threonine-protein kinase